MSFAASEHDQVGMDLAKNASARASQAMLDALALCETEGQAVTVAFKVLGVIAAHAGGVFAARAGAPPSDLTASETLEMMASILREHKPLADHIGDANEMARAAPPIVSDVPRYPALNSLSSEERHALKLASMGMLFREPNGWHCQNDLTAPLATLDAMAVLTAHGLLHALDPDTRTITPAGKRRWERERGREIPARAQDAIDHLKRGAS